jgi:hypothetical protein
MQEFIVDHEKCGIDIVTEDHWTTVVLTELSGDFLRSKYNVFATKIYQERFKGKVDPLNIIWIGQIPETGRFEVLMPWHRDQAAYGEPDWHKMETLPQGRDHTA